MPHPGSPRRAASLLTLPLLLAVLLALPASASAQGYTCEASAFAVTLGPSPRTEPITANKGEPTCKEASAGANAPASPLPVTGSLLSATTALEPPTGAPSAQTASAAGGLGSLAIAGLPIPLEQPDLSALPGPAQTLGIDIRGAVEALVPDSFSAELLNLRAVRAEVTGSCVNGSPRLTGTSSVLGISVLGTELPVDRAVSQTVNVVDSSNLVLSSLTPAQLGLPNVPGVDAVIANLPTISIPATVAQLRVTPGRKIEGGGKLTQHALDLTLAVGGQTVVDLTVGEATVGAAAVNCGGVADLALQCTTRRIVLIDVLRSKGRVKLFGVADRRFTGRRVTVRFTATNKIVARPVVRRTGLFTATAPLPRRKIRATNRARYIARIGKEKSFKLKLVRRMLVSSTRVRARKVTITGRVVLPLAAPVRQIVVKRRVSCGRYRVIKRFTPPANGRFRVTLGGPPSRQAAAYRLQTRVRKFTSNPKTYPTFTLPRYVDLAS